MGSSISVLAVVATTVSLLVAILGITLEQMGKKLDLVANAVLDGVPKPRSKPELMYGWKLDHLDQIRKRWHNNEMDDPMDLVAPAFNDATEVKDK